MTAARVNRVRKLRRQRLYVALLALPVPLLAFGLGGLAVHLALSDGPTDCLRDVNSFVKHVESTLPPDPAVVRAVFARVTEAASLCERGDPAQANELLRTLRESLRV